MKAIVLHTYFTHITSHTLLHTHYFGAKAGGGDHSLSQRGGGFVYKIFRFAA